MSEIRKWLETIGLGQYADAFEANDIDIDLLAQVDDQLLKDIGISSAGHRLRIRNAITKLGAHVQSETADGPPMSARRCASSARTAVPRGALPSFAGGGIGRAATG